MTTNYIITTTDGSYFATVPEGTLLQQSGLDLIGKNYVGFGQALNDNLVALAENFASSVSPNGPLTGQLWYNKASNTLNVYSGSAFNNVVTGFFQNTTPKTANQNQLWFDTLNQKLYVYNAGSFQLVGPNTSSSNTSVIADQILDTSGNYHQVLRIKIEGKSFAIITEDSFVPASPQSGFSSSSALNPGINLGDSTTPSYNNSAVLPYKVYGVATLADGLNETPIYGSGQTKGLTADKLVRNDVSGTINGSLTINNGISVGQAPYGTLILDGSTNTLYLKNNFTAADLEIEVVNTSGTNVHAITAKGATGYVGINETNPATQLHVNGDTTLGGNVTISGTATGVTDLSDQGSSNLATTQYVKNQFINATLTGISTSTTPPASENSNRIATTRWIKQQGFATSSGISGITVEQLGVSINTAPVTTLNFIGAITAAPSASGSANAVDITVQAPSISAGVPSGMVAMWYGVLANVPYGWAVCDGRNGTPDLRDRFVVGAGTTYNLNDTGGATSSTTATAGSHSHTGSTGSTALTTSQLPAHSHDTITVGLRHVSNGGSADNILTTVPDSGRAITNFVSSTGGGQGHSHTISTDGVHSHVVATLPPYYALYYIMKL